MPDESFAESLRQPCTVPDCPKIATYRVFWREGEGTAMQLMCDEHAYAKNRERGGNASLFALND